MNSLFAIINRQAAEMETAAAAAVELTIDRGAGMYIRERHLAGILGDLSIFHITPHEPERTERIIELLDGHIDCLRAGIMARHWSADRNALLATLQARRAEAAKLAKLEGKAA